MSEINFGKKKNEMKVHQKRAEPWTVTLVDTGDNSMTGGRLGRVAEYVKYEDAFCFTYGDGVSDVDISELLAVHKADSALVTLTAVQPPGRFGALTLRDGQTRVSQFLEKPEGDGAWINGGYFAVEPKAIDFIDGDHTSWEQEPLASIARNNQLSAYKHHGFWQPMDTLRDKHYLENLWRSQTAPWKLW